MASWIRSYWDVEDITFLWEVGDDGWVTRSVELVGPDHRPQAAAMLAEELHARDRGGLPAVQAYETRYGGTPEAPVHEWDTGFPHDEISRELFEEAWEQSRRVLEQADPGGRHRRSVWCGRTD